MNIIKSFKGFNKVNEEVDNKITLYRLTSKSVIDIDNPGKFYFSDLSKVNPNFLEDKSGDLYLITGETDLSNIDNESSKIESDRLGCDCIKCVKDDSKVEVISIEAYK